MFYYKLYGLDIVSELHLPDIPMNESVKTATNPIIISFRKVSAKGIKNTLVKGLFYQISAAEAWYHIPSIAYLSIRKGQSIIVHPKKNGDENTLQECILTIGLHALLKQREFFVAPGACIKSHDHCFAILGASGAGKSTLAAAFFNQGDKILSDDLVVINKQGEVMPGYPFLKLWARSLNELGFAEKALKKVRTPIHKYLLPLVNQFHPTPSTLKGIIILQDSNTEAYTFETITGVKKIQILQQFLSQKINVPRGALSSNLIHLAQRVFIESIARPHSEFKLAECLKYIENKIKERALCHE